MKNIRNRLFGLLILCGSSLTTLHAQNVLVDQTQNSKGVESASLYGVTYPGIGEPPVIAPYVYVTKFQEFIPTQSNVSAVELNLQITGGAACSSSITISIEGSDGNMHATLYSGNSVTTDGWHRFEFNPVSVTPGEKYRLEFKSAADSGLDYFVWKGTNNSYYRVGEGIRSSNTHLSYGTFPKSHFAFRTFGDPPPQPISIERSTPNNQLLASHTEVHFIVEFSEEVSHIDEQDFEVVNVTNNGVAIGTITEVIDDISPSNNKFLVKVDGISGANSGDTEFGLQLSAGNDITDTIGQPVAGDFPISESYIIPDRIGPRAIFSMRSNPVEEVITLETGEVVFNARFSESVTGIDIEDFTLQIISGNMDVEILEVTNILADRCDVRVAINSESKWGEVNLGISPTANFHDLIGNVNSPDNFVIRQNYDLLDTEAPVLQSILRHDPTESYVIDIVPVTFEVSFDELVENVDISDFELIATGDVQASVASVTDIDGSTYRITTTNVKGIGQLDLQLTPGHNISDESENIAEIGGGIIEFYELEAIDPDDFLTVSDLGYQYQYDARGRQVIKKIPGAEEIYMVYDDRDRLVLTQDGNRRAQNQWSFTKYDQLNRVIMSGIVVIAGSRQTVQQSVNDFYLAGNDFYELSTIGGFHGYTNQSYPLLSEANEVINISYYDDYAFMAGHPNAQRYEFTPEVSLGLENYFERLNGQMTGSKTKVLGSSDEYLLSVSYFDDRLSNIQTKSDNILGGIDKSCYEYDFVGNVVNSLITHNDHYEKGAYFTMKNRVVYDHMLRPTKTYNKLYSPTWVNLVNSLSENPGVLRRDASIDGSWGNSGASSKEVLKADEDGWVEFMMPVSNHYVAVGLSTVDSDAHYNSIGYGFYAGLDSITNNPTFSIIENGEIVFESTAERQESDKMKIQREMGVIRYLLNDTLIYTSTTGISDEEFVVDVATVKSVETQEAKLLCKISFGEEILARETTYNALGQEIKKNIHSSDDNTFAQSVNYSYNIRGWMQSINDPDTNDGEGSLFSMKLYYDMPNGNEATPQFNGNISSQRWTTPLLKSQNSVPGLKNGTLNYNYTYDPLQRLKSATFRVD